MREILLNSKHYKLAPNTDVQQHQINPWNAVVRQSGGLEYQDFSNAELEEYSDFRNGIGKYRGVGSDARLQWSNGVDVTIDGQATLNALVNTADYDVWEANHAYVLLNFVIPSTADGYCYECTTAGTSHATTEPTWDDTVGNTTSDGTVTWTCRAYLAPIKIIDFQSSTYVIQNSRILKWDGTNLDCVDNTFASPIDAIVVTDATDEYLVVSSATSAIYTPDGTTWTTMPLWASPTSYTDADSKWTNEANAYDNDTSTYATTTLDVNIAWGSYLQLIHAGVWCGSIRYYAYDYDAAITSKIDVDVYYNGAWHDVYEGAFTTDTWETKTISGGPFLVTIARIRFYNAHATTDPEVRLKEFAFGNAGFGYLANYENRLYLITTDGKGITYSVVKDVDAFGGSFELTGNFGTVYALFDGKLLSDGTPVLYFTGTQGTYSLDTTNKLAYQQEVSYPPLTYAGHKGLYWNANLWVATGYGILKIAPSVATDIGPNMDDGLPSTYQGYIYDMVTVNNWLVYCVNGGTTDRSSILKRNSSYGGNLQVYTTSVVNKAIACLWHSPSSLYTNGRLWFGEGTTVKYMMFPDTTSNPKQIATYEYYNDSDYAILPIFRKLAVIPKVALGVAAITKSCNATDYLQIYYGLNGAAATTSLGTFITSPKPTTLTFGSGLGTEFYTIQLAFKIIQGATNTNSAELESLLFYYYAAPARIDSFIFTILATGDEGEEIFTEFETIRDTNTLVAFYPSGDAGKTGYNVKLTKMPSREWWENRGRREGFFQCVCEEVWNG